MKRDKGLVRTEAVFFFNHLQNLQLSLFFFCDQSDRLYFYFIYTLCSDFGEQSV